MVVQDVQCHVHPSLFILSVGVLLHAIGSVDAQDRGGVPHLWCLIKRFRVLELFLFVVETKKGLGVVSL